jgi:hypothetical protein
MQIAGTGGAAEQPLSGAEHGREDEQGVLVDEVVFPQGVDDAGAADDDDVAIVLARWTRSPQRTRALQDA